jgi:hypothetical protein
MNLLREVFDRLSGVENINHKLDSLIPRIEKLTDLILQHEHRLTKIETQFQTLFKHEKITTIL